MDIMGLLLRELGMGRERRKGRKGRGREEREEKGGKRKGWKKKGGEGIEDPQMGLW